MSARVVALALVVVMIGAAAPAPLPAPMKLAPADDVAPLVGAAARAKRGIDPLVRPTDDLGMAEDPPGAGISPEQATPGNAVEIPVGK